MAAGGSLTSKQDIPLEKRTACIMAIIFSAFEVLTVWKTSGLLVRIPRLDRPFQGDRKKAISLCLISISVISGTQWLITSIERKSFPIKKLYFGDTHGEGIGVLLEPFETIFELHAAIMAYELYCEL